MRTTSLVGYWFLSATAQECGWTIISMTLRVGALRWPNPSWMRWINRLNSCRPTNTTTRYYYLVCRATFGQLVICPYEAQQFKAWLMNLDGLKRIMLRPPAHPIKMRHEILHGWSLLSTSAHTSHVVPRSKKASRSQFGGVIAH